jgi:biopolymer transport protein ExbB/TolQ
MNAMDIFREGGFIMYPLLIFSILIWIIAIQKYLYLNTFTKQYLKVDEEVHRSITANRIDDFKWVVKNAAATIARPHEVIFDDAYGSKEEVSEKLQRRLTETNSSLKKNLWILGTIGSSAPFVGLFGTVLGIMDSFRSIGESGKSGFTVVAAGISESLIATASGIIVAVIAVIFYNYFQTRVNAIAQDFRNKIEDTAELVFLAKRNRK